MHHGCLSKGQLYAPEPVTQRSRMGVAQIGRGARHQGGKRRDEDAGLSQVLEVLAFVGQAASQRGRRHQVHTDGSDQFDRAHVRNVAREAVAAVLELRAGR